MAEKQPLFTISLSPDEVLKEGPSSWGATLAAVTFFLVLGLNWLPIIFSYQTPPLFNTGRLLLFWAAMLLPAAGLSIGWIQGFPRWSYPYVVMAYFTSLYMANAATPGLAFFNYEFGPGDLWSWRAFVPLFLAIIIAVWATRSVRPLFRGADNIARDQSLITFGLYGALPLLVAISFDDMDQALRFQWQSASFLVILLSVLAYMRGSSRVFRAGSLLVGALFTFGVTTIIPGMYWNGNARAYIPLWMLTALMTVLLFAGPAILSVTLHREKKAF